MSQQPFAFAGQESVTASLNGAAKRVLTTLRSPQFQISITVNIALLAFSIEAVRPDSGYATMQLFLTFNALILGYFSSFWGLWIDASSHGFDGIPYSPRRTALAERDRLLWSLAPTFLGAGGMLLPLFLPQDIGTLMLLTGFSLLVTLEALGPRRGLQKADYRPLRWSISLFAIVMLIDVLANQRWDYRILF